MSPFRRLLPYIDRYRTTFVLGLISSVLTTAVTIAAPLVLRTAIDGLATGVTNGKLLQYAALLLGIGVVGGVFRFWTRRLLIGASRHIEYDMRNDFFAHLQKLPLSYFQANRTGDLMSRATNDLNAVRMMIGPSIMYSANTLLTFVVALTLIRSGSRFRISASLAIIAARYGPTLGLSQMMVTSQWAIRPPRSRTSLLA